MEIIKYDHDSRHIDARFEKLTKAQLKQIRDCIRQATLSPIGITKEDSWEKKPNSLIPGSLGGFKKKVAYHSNLFSYYFSRVKGTVSYLSSFEAKEDDIVYYLEITTHGDKTPMINSQIESTLGLFSNTPVFYE